MYRALFVLVTCVFTIVNATASEAIFKQLNDEVPPRSDGLGQFQRLVIRGAYVIDGTGAPPYGPADIVIKGNRIEQVKVVGFPGRPIDPAARPAQGDFEIDAHGKFVLPGFIDTHSHIHSLEEGQGVSPDYIFKLWLGHGVTTARNLWDPEDRTLLLKNSVTAMLLPRPGCRFIPILLPMEKIWLALTMPVNG